MREIFESIYNPTDIKAYRNEHEVGFYTAKDVLKTKALTKCLEQASSWQDIRDILYYKETGLWLEKTK